MTKVTQIQDIHQEDVAETYYRLIDEDLQEFLKQKGSFTECDCPACQSPFKTHAFDYQDLSYWRCTECETLYISPAPSEAQHLDYVTTSSAMAYWRDEMPESMKRSRLPMYEERLSYSQAIFKKMGITPKHVLELGAGNGEFANELLKSYDDVSLTVLEPQPLDVPSDRVTYLNGGFEVLASHAMRYDVAFAWELIEHLLEPDAFLQNVRHVLKEDALFILSTPNEKSLETRSLQTASSNIVFDHVRLYNPRAIETLLQRNGFKVIELTTPGKLDAEKLQRYYQDHPEALKDPSLQFLLEENNEDAMRALQDTLVQTKQSSHMRVIAVKDPNWSPSVTPYEAEMIHNTSAKSAPQNFNEVVLPHSKSTHNPYPEQLMRYVLHDLVKAPHRGRVLDFGGGWGLQASIMKQLGYDAVSVDREKASANVESYRCDVVTEPLPFEDNSFDIIFSKSVIEHFYVDQLPHIMTELQRVLKKGGVIIFLTPDWASNMKEFYQIFTHVTPYTVSSMQQCLKMYGFENVMARTIMQLPSTWHSTAIERFARMVACLRLPRSWGKLARWSQERLLVGVGYKP